MIEEIDRLQERIGYKFNNTEFLHTALTHSSYANENRAKKLKDNERLEFLGDSVLGLISAELLFMKYKHLPEGGLTKIRAAVVCEEALAGYSKEFALGDAILLGCGEERTGGRDRASILADGFEALLAAIFLDGGLDEARKFALPFIEREIEKSLSKFGRHDYKTMLQEIVQQNPGEQLKYLFVGAKGPDHDRIFEVDVYINSNKIGSGSGKSKKEAEQAAAEQALKLMGQA